MSDCPRTDAATTKGCGLMVSPDFARTLGRGLAKEKARAAQAYQDCSGFELAVRRFRERANQAEAKLSEAMDQIRRLQPLSDYYCPDCREHFRAPREPGPHPKQVACPKGHVHNTYEACRD